MKSQSQLQPPEASGKRAFISLIAAALIIGVALCGTVTYAWFSASSGEAVLNIDSDGLKITARLYYTDETNMQGFPAETAYTELARGAKRTITGGAEADENPFYAGSVLAYKVSIKNCSDENPHDTAIRNGTNGSTYGETARIELSMAGMRSYFDDAVATELLRGETVNGIAYTDAYTNELIDDSLATNSGAMMFRFTAIEFRITAPEGAAAPPAPVNPLTGNVYETAASGRYIFPLSQNINETAVSRSYSEGENFFEFDGLLPGYTLDVYYMLECMESFEAVGYYTSLRNEEAGALRTEAAALREEGKTAEADAAEARADAIEAVLNRELQSIVIDYDGSGGETGGGQSSAVFNIEYFSVYARSVERAVQP